MTQQTHGSSKTHPTSRPSQVTQGPAGPEGHCPRSECRVPAAVARVPRSVASSAQLLHLVPVRLGVDLRTELLELVAIRLGADLRPQLLHLVGIGSGGIWRTPHTEPRGVTRAWTVSGQDTGLYSIMARQVSSKA